MSMSQGNEPGVDAMAQVRKGAAQGPQALIVGRATQPLGFMDTVNARVPGFEDITDQPDWGDNGFSGRKSDLRVVRFNRQPPTPVEAAQSAADERS